ncbi:unnamed protein product [Amoebophrya sp. A120]|nr:unnamed protein product [Amoebophrya sp. A120]|eukprot:GSA120T00006866001.1
MKRDLQDEARKMTERCDKMERKRKEDVEAQQLRVQALEGKVEERIAGVEKQVEASHKALEEMMNVKEKNIKTSVTTMQTALDSKIEAKHSSMKKRLDDSLKAHQADTISAFRDIMGEGIGDIKKFMHSDEYLHKVNQAQAELTQRSQGEEDEGPQAP